MSKQNSRPHRQQSELIWARVVMRKWLNLTNNNSDYSADTDSDSDSDSVSNSDPENCQWPAASLFKNDRSDGVQVEAYKALPRIRRKSETFRAQYINKKEIRICAGTWNVGGRVPPDDLDLDGWLDIDEPADVYVIGLQEIIPLNAGNIFGAEDRRPASIWENTIRETLKKIPPVTEFKSHSNPPSPSRFKLSEDAPNIDEILQTDSDFEEEICPLNEESIFVSEIKDGTVTGENVVDLDASVSIDKHNLEISVEKELQRQFSSPIMLDSLNCFGTEDSEVKVALPSTQYINKLARTLSGIERIGLSWPEPPLHLLGQHSKSFKSNMAGENRMRSYIASLAKLDLESLLKPKKRSPYVKIVSKQMVGVLITIWVRRSLRRHIKNLNVSSVGVGVMGYIGNKGSISVSMSIHQTLFCFICSHLTSGEKDADAAKRSAVVQEIHRRTLFNSLSSIGLPKSIRDHERIIWLGDLNYRLNLSYEKTRELISKKDWAKLAEHDQLIRELRKGRAFDGWSEGTLNFAPTYKYETNSDTYCGEDSRAGRRTPACCFRHKIYKSPSRPAANQVVANNLIFLKNRVFSESRKFQLNVCFKELELCYPMLSLRYSPAIFTERLESVEFFRNSNRNVVVCAAKGPRPRYPRVWKTNKKIGTISKSLKLVECIKGLSNVKEEVYGALDSFIAWEVEFPLITVKKALKTLENEKEWKRIIQVTKWMLSKGQGNTMGSYFSLLNALAEDGRLDEAEELWKKLFSQNLESMPRIFFEKMISIYYHREMHEKTFETFADMEELGIRPMMSIVSMVGDVFEKLGMLDKCRKLKKKYPPPKWEYRYFKGKRVKVRAKYLEETGNTDLNKTDKEAEVNSYESNEDAEVSSHELSDESGHINVAEVYSTVPFETVDSKIE